MSSVHSVVLCVLAVVEDAEWVAGVADSSLGQTSDYEADEACVCIDIHYC